MLEKTFDYEGRTITVTSVTYRYYIDKSPQDGVLIHDESDEFHDGDAIYHWPIDYIKTAEDLKSLFEDFGDTVFTKLKDGTYYTGERLTASDIAQSWIDNADETPHRISTKTAAQYIEWMDPDQTPEDLTPEEFADAWNDIIG